jgi:hypothetical protein
MVDDAPQGPWYPRIIYVQRGQTPPIATDAEAARLDDLMPPWLFEPRFLRFMDSHHWPSQPQACSRRRHQLVPPGGGCKESDAR